MRAIFTENNKKDFSHYDFNEIFLKSLVVLDMVEPNASFEDIADYFGLIFSDFMNVFPPESLSDRHNYMRFNEFVIGIERVKNEIIGRFIDEEFFDLYDREKDELNGIDVSKQPMPNRYTDVFPLTVFCKKLWGDFKLNEVEFICKSFELFKVNSLENSSSLIEKLNTSTNPNLKLGIIINDINNAFFRLERFMKGTGEYEYFGFNNAFTLLFNEAKKPINFTISNCELIDNYLSLIHQVAYEFDKSDFENTDGYENPEFCQDCNEMVELLIREEEFNYFLSEEPKISIKDIIKITALPKTQQAPAPSEEVKASTAPVEKQEPKKISNDDNWIERKVKKQYDYPFEEGSLEYIMFEMTDREKEDLFLKKFRKINPHFKGDSWDNVVEAIFLASEGRMIPLKREANEYLAMFPELKDSYILQEKLKAFKENKSLDAKNFEGSRPTDECFLNLEESKEVFCDCLFHPMTALSLTELESCLLNLIAYRTNLLHLEYLKKLSISTPAQIGQGNASTAPANEEKTELTDDQSIIFNHIKHLKGNNLNREKIMTDDNFNKLFKDLCYLVEKDAVPEIEKPLSLKGITNISLLHTIRLIHNDLIKTRKIRPSFKIFLKTYFHRLSNYSDMSVEFAKALKKPNIYPY